MSSMVNDLLKISGDYRVGGKSIKYSQLIPNGKINVSRTLSGVQIGNSLDPYITIINPIVGHKVYARIVTSNNRVRVGWYKGLNSGYDFVTGEAITSSSSTPTATEGIYTITQDMVHSGTNYLQLYFFNCSGATPDTYNITIQLFDLTEAGFDDIAPLRESVFNFGTGIINATSPISFYKDDKSTTLTRTGRVDLGTLGWYYDASLSVFSASISTAKQYEYGEEVSAYCPKYEVMKWAGIIEEVENEKAMFNWSNRTIRIKTSKYPDLQSFIPAMSGVYLEYETTEPLVLRGINNLKSLTGKQNELTELRQETNTSLSLINGAWFYGWRYDSLGKICSVLPNHKYALIVKGYNIGKLSYDRSVFTPFNTSGNISVGGNQSYYYNDDDTFVLTENFNISTETDIYGFWKNFRDIQTLKAVPESYSFIDLTELGLDSLNAQQIYERYNQYFDLIANGQSVSLLADEYQNCSGKVIRRLGEVDLGDYLPVQILANGVFQYHDIIETPQPAYRVKPNILCNKYEVGTMYEIDNQARDKIIGIGNAYQRPSIYDSSLVGKTKEEIKTAMSGVKLIYELETPVVEQHGTIMVSRKSTKAIDSNKIELGLVGK